MLMTPNLENLLPATELMSLFFSWKKMFKQKICWLLSIPTAFVGSASGKMCCKTSLVDTDVSLKSTNLRGKFENSRWEHQKPIKMGYKTINMVLSLQGKAKDIGANHIAFLHSQIWRYLSRQCPYWESTSIALPLWQQLGKPTYDACVSSCPTWEHAGQGRQEWDFSSTKVYGLQENCLKLLQDWVWRKSSPAWLRWWGRKQVKKIQCGSTFRSGEELIFFLEEIQTGWYSETAAPHLKPLQHFGRSLIAIAT